MSYPVRITETKTQKDGGLTLDPSGFFIIRVVKEERKIYLEHYRKDGKLNEIIHGEDATSICCTAVEHGLVTRLDHAIYLGRELEKAYISMLYGLRYIQDEERIF